MILHAKDPIHCFGPAYLGETAMAIFPSVLGVVALWFSSTAISRAVEVWAVCHFVANTRDEEGSLVGTLGSRGQ
jgi:hypothetical protein